MDQNTGYEFFDTLFLRAPYYSFEDFSLSRMPEILALQEFRNALWLASPDFYHALEKKGFVWVELDKKEQFSIYKYYNRMSFRPTPFGAFSSFSLVKWSDKDHIKLCAREDATLHILPSRQWQEQFDIAMQNGEKDYCLRTNPTLFRVGNNYRFIKSVTSESGKIKFHVNEIKTEKLNIYITEQCRKKPVSKTEINGRIADLTGCSLEEAGEYSSFLITEQVIMTEYHGSLIVSSFSKSLQVNSKINAIEMDPLKNFWQHSIKLPLSGNVLLTNLSKEVESIAPVKGLNLNKGVFYACLERTAEVGGITNEVRKDLLAAVSLLTKIVIPYPTPALKDFTKAFKIKFQEQRIPLLEALDPDIGISYGGLHTTTKKNGLLEDLIFPFNSSVISQLDWTSVHRLFLRIWIRNPRRSFYEPVIINDDQLPELDNSFPEAKLPPSLAIVFVRAGNKLILDNLGGASALSLIGRFSAFSREVEGLCREVAREESAVNADMIFAEVHQLSDTHVDNINRRTPIYDHVITINTFPVETAQKEIALNDLVVSVRQEELWLESVSLEKRIIPRLPTAYNFHHNDLGIFQMLCDLQFQGLQANLTFDLEKLFPGLDFYPRVEYYNTVICVARWRITEKEAGELLMKPLSIGRLHQFRQNRGIPGLITMGLSDQQLTFDLVNDDEAIFFLECLKENKSVTVREYIASDRRITVKGKALTGQFVTLLKNPHSVYSNISGKIHAANSKIQRDFPLGSGWLYLKIYCTPESSDNLLVNVIAPFLKANSKEISLWFFIRYQDSEPHIRLRVKSQKPDSALLLTAINKKLSLKQNKDLIREIKSETYQREIERYSEELIEAVEGFFWAGSEWVLTRLKSKVHPVNLGNEDIIPFYLIYLLAFEFLKNASELSLFFKWRSDSFMKEFGGEKPLKVTLDGKYRRLSHELQDLLDNPISAMPPKGRGKTLENLLKQLSVISTRSADWSRERRHRLLADLIHMQVNRMFFFKQRQHEALICYCLYKYSVSTEARKTEV